MAYDIDNPSPAVKSFARWLQDKKQVPVTEREVMATNARSQEWQEWEVERSKAGLPFLNRTQSVDDPSEPAKPRSTERIGGSGCRNEESAL
jgi:hypothetical protein